MMKINVEQWGLIEYQQAYARQRQVVEEVIAGERERLILCEHTPVITLGRMTNPESLLYSREEIAREGIQVVSVDRGGDVTMHMPGQLVIYVMLDLNRRGRDLRTYMQQLEQVAVDLLLSFGILAIGIEGKRGVFVGPHKIVSIGVGVRKWVTFHGLGINIANDLNLFRLIRPCGLDVQMTSMERLINGHLSPLDVAKRAEELFKKSFEGI